MVHKRILRAMKSDEDAVKGQGASRSMKDISASAKGLIQVPVGGFFEKSPGRWRGEGKYD